MSKLEMVRKLQDIAVQINDVLADQVSLTKSLISHNSKITAAMSSMLQTILELAKGLENDN